MPTDAKVATVTERYLAELLPVFSDDSKRALPWTFFLDSGIASGRFVDLVSESMYPWHVQVARLNDRFRQQIGRAAIRRVNPVVSREYSDDDLRLIKYNLHFQLALGLEVHLVMVDAEFSAEKDFGADNLAVVARQKLITDHSPYDPHVPSELRIEWWSNSLVRDIYHTLDGVGRKYQLFKLHYTDDAFKCSRVDVKRRFGQVLYALQAGRCAISGERLVGDWHVDHILPIEQGGNNTLINLQATNAKPNILKGGKVTEPAFCFTVPQMIAAGLGATHHQRLMNRRLVGVSVGLSALFQLESWMN